LKFRRAAGLARRSDSPEVAAIIFNNAAVMSLLLAKGQKGLMQSQKWLRLAADVKGGLGVVPRGKKLAMYNLRQLSKGLF
jgi:hypothetical protein